MYKDKHGITQITKGNRDSLSISFDEDLRDEVNQKIPVLLHIPFKSEGDYEHTHIPMTREGAVILRQWLDAYLKDTKPTKYTKGGILNTDVHTEHCCAYHGCKYGDGECPVLSGEKKQSFPCNDCE